MILGCHYEIISPVYDDYDENLKPEVELVNVIGKTKNGLIFQDLNNNLTYEKSFLFLKECDIKLIKS